jgi:hypothetical protein
MQKLEEKENLPPGGARGGMRRMVDKKWCSLGKGGESALYCVNLF